MQFVKAYECWRSSRVKERKGLIARVNKMKEEVGGLLAIKQLRKSQ